MCPYGPLEDHVAIWPFEGPCCPLRNPVATSPFFQGPYGHPGLWGPCGHLSGHERGHVATWAFEGSCAHLALRKATSMWLPRTLSGYVSVWLVSGAMSPSRSFAGHVAIWHLEGLCDHLTV